MKANEKNQFVGGLVSAVVYFAVAFFGARIFDVSVWKAFAALLLARAFFGIVESVVGFVNWRLFSRGNTIRGFIDVLRANQFPPRFNKHDDFLNYLARIEGGSYSESLKQAANEFERVLGAIEAQGIIAGARIHAASEAALEVYSPKKSAPER